MEDFTLARTGLPPLKFSGEKIASVDGWRVGSKEQNRWHDLAVYRTAGNRYVLEIAFRSRWDGDTDHVEVHHSLAPGDLIDQLTVYDPLEHVSGYPPGDAYREKQARLEQDICRRFRAGISELYEGLPVRWFAEEIA